MVWSNKRNKTAPVNRHEDGARTSIGDSYVNEACSKLNIAALRECNVYLERFEAGAILNWFFDEEVLRRLRLVKDLVQAKYTWANYRLLPDAQLFIDFEHLNVPTILPVAFKPAFTKCLPVIEAVKKAQEIQHRYARVKHMLRWFNRNATPGAVRAYWPAVLALCPDSPSMRAMFDAAPQRHDVPRDVGKMLPLIRETASTVAAMELLPGNMNSRERNNVWFSLESSEADFEGAPYSTEQLTINV